MQWRHQNFSKRETFYGTKNERSKPRGLFSRGGVEDTRLEAKAKDTKKPRPRPRTAFPRTDTLEAKDRNARGQGAISKKKKKRSSQKFFKRSPQKNVFQKIFQALHKILTIQKIVLSSSRGQANFRGLEASLEAKAKDFKMCPWGLHLCYLARNQDLLKRKDQNRKLKRFINVSKLGDVVSKLVQLKHVTTGAWRRSHQPPEAMGVWGRSTRALGDFCKFLEKMAILMPFGSHFSRFQSHLKEQHFWDLRANWTIPPFTSSQVQNTFKILQF